MLRYELALVSLLFSSLVRAYPWPYTYSSFETRQAVNTRPFGKPSVKAADPYDHAWIETYTALGDSYSVGLGAGHAIKAAKGLELNTDCYQYSYGYPNLLNEDGMIGINPYRNFQYLGCSGAVMTDIRDKQVPKMQKSQLVTLSAGGNDADFATILNYCVYQWATHFFTTCDGRINSVNATINSDDYLKSMKSLINSIKPKLDGSNARVYWVSYQKFWDTSTNECDSVTWAFTRNYFFRQFLTQDRRKKMNSLVDNVNSKIKAVCDATSQFVYIDTSTDIDTLKGHFCESGVDESYHWIGGGVSKNRDVTWFYEWGTTIDDDSGEDGSINQPEKRSIPPIVADDIALDERAVASGAAHDESLSLSPPQGTSFEDSIRFFIAAGIKDQTMNVTSLSDSADPSNITAQFLPDSYGRIFHLDKYANGDIALRILDAMDSEQAKMMSQPLSHITLTICLPQATATAPPACVGNQIEGTCTQASLPSAKPDSGPQQPVCNKVGGTSTYRRINDTQANQAAVEYCANLISGGVVLSAGNAPPNPGAVANAAENGGQLSYAVLFDVDSCDPGTSPANQKLDFQALGQAQCQMYLYQILAQVCVEDKTWSDYNPNYSLQGGTYTAHCAMWSLDGLPPLL